MSTTTKKRRPSREQSMTTWLQAGEQRAQDARDGQAIDAAEYEREHDHLSPAVDDHIEAAQRRYERSIGMTHD